MSLNVFGDQPASLAAFKDREMSNGDDFRIAEHVGKVVILKVHGPKDVQTANYGVKTAISLDAVVLDDEGKGTEFTDALVFNAAPVDQLKGYAGQTIVAVVDSYTAKSGTKAPRLAAPNEEQQALAAKYKG